ncbi:hypothetical protein WA158_005407 [Blastocystis sp. Blastoise]
MFLTILLIIDISLIGLLVKGGFPKNELVLRGDLNKSMIDMNDMVFSNSSVSQKEDYDVTLITQTSSERLFYFAHIVQRWSGPMVATIYLKQEDQNDFDTFVNSASLSQRLQLIQFHPLNESIYPYNKLRNIAVANVITSHFWLTDMDMWPSEKTYESLRSLPQQVLSNDLMAIIVPAFEYKNNIECKEFEACVNKVIPHIPRNHDELKNCISEQNCRPFRPNAWVHNYLTEDWYKAEYYNPLMLVPCFQSVKQEPYIYIYILIHVSISLYSLFYIMVKRTESLPPFDERFINYGKDKISWIEHLRYSGYIFAVMKDAFAIDIPHPRSDFANTFYKQLTHDPLSVDMNILWFQFIKELHQNFTDKSVTYLCDKKGKNY